ncbi:hypothetical protein EYF80_016518 [Liparis tanakae]|uniref:Uncharacterized protein n=1 Tax=Liparis tanakae TaxID=230148 RepID=A0A4Z2I7C3_9TELE|nr:hypothetical protein EYF80_016518 [Liparis tanakae]
MDMHHRVGTGTGPSGEHADRIGDAICGAACDRPFGVVVVGVVLYCWRACLPLDVHGAMFASVSDVASSALRTGDRL